MVLPYSNLKSMAWVGEGSLNLASIIAIEADDDRRDSPFRSSAWERPTSELEAPDGDRREEATSGFVAVIRRGAECELTKLRSP